MNDLNYITNWQDVVDYVLSQYPKEACGIINMDNKFIPCDNIADNPLETFKIKSTIFLEHKVKAILHSHPHDPSKNLELDPRTPSKADMQGQIDTGVEWCIVVTEGENVTQPVWWGDRNHRPPLMDREFIHSLQDCSAFATDWLYKEYGVDLPYYPREYDWFLTGNNFIEDHYSDWGFRDVTNEPRQRGDITLYRIRSQVVNHMGVMLDENTIVHHQWGRFPKTEPYSVWEKYVTRRIRLNKI